MGRAFFGFVGFVPVWVSLLACGSVSDHPLGGPYGGTGGVAAPTSGSSNPSGGGGSDPTGAIGGGAPDGGSTVLADDGGLSPADEGGSPLPAAPTWTAIYNSYFAPTSIGHCATGSGCHNEMLAADTSYTFLQTQGDINGTASRIANPSKTRLAWEGGDMPQDYDGGALPQAEADLKAWAAAGALNN